MHGLGGGQPDGLVLCDTMGLGEGAMTGITLHDILSIIKGHVPEGHKVRTGPLLPYCGYRGDTQLSASLSVQSRSAGASASDSGLREEAEPEGEDPLCGLRVGRLENLHLP